MLLSVMILTHNEQKHIAECLASLKGLADEVIVVDDFSIDQTVQIAKNAGAKVYWRKLDSFSSQRNYAIEKCEGKWVFVLDADERLTPELANEIKHVITISNEISALAIPRRNHFMAKWIKHCGWYPDYSWRLFKKGKVSYSGLVHEHLNIDGKTGRLLAPFEHYTYDSVEQYIKKLNKYTTMAAEELLQRGKKASAFDIVIRPPLTFFKMYFLRKGICDGLEGFLISILSSFYVFAKYTKLYYRQAESVND